MRVPKEEPVEEGDPLYSFPATVTNGVVSPVHPKAMSVLLTTEDEWSTWLEALAEKTFELQQPLPDEMMKAVARGARKDEG